MDLKERLKPEVDPFYLERVPWRSSHDNNFPDVRIACYDGFVMAHRSDLVIYRNKLG